MRLLSTLWHDECGGFLNSAELVFLGTILVIGIVPGMASLRDGIVTELHDMSHAVDGIAPPFAHPSHPGHPDHPGHQHGGPGAGRSNQVTVCSDLFQ